MMRNYITQFSEGVHEVLLHELRRGSQTFRLTSDVHVSSPLRNLFPVVHVETSIVPRFQDV